jgi:membrane-associated phospholipid phosphatase
MSLAARLLLLSTLSLSAVRAQEPEEPLISYKQFVVNIAHDQKPIFTFPAKLATGKHWKPFAFAAAGTAGLVVLDPYIEPFFHDKGHFNNAKTGPMRGRNTTLAVTMTPVAFYLTSLVTHDTYTRNTALLTAEGLIDTQIVSQVVKTAIGRLKPSDIPINGNYRDTWFKYKGQWYNRGGFPSGHTASAFAVATVISGRYPKHRWVPIVAYTAATALSLSRLPTLAHFPSDIFIGAAMGYSIGHFVVLKK